MECKDIPVKIIDFEPEPIDIYKGSRFSVIWGLFHVIAVMPDGIAVKGACEGDEYDNWALETFERDSE